MSCESIGVWLFLFLLGHQIKAALRDNSLEFPALTLVQLLNHLCIISWSLELWTKVTVKNVCEEVKPNAESLGLLKEVGWQLNLWTY